MGVIFISHSSKNNAQAVRVRDWLREQGWKEAFLDLDPEHGLAPGQRWQDELKRAGERCSAVVVLVSREWAASKWCLTEFLLASQLGKRIFPVIIEPTPFADLPIELTAHFQLADISEASKEADGFERLRIGLKRAGLDPTDFQWPPPGQPTRPPYRGLKTLEEEDAAIFFGRDASITKGLDALRRMRDGAPERMLVILGASGAGKSSFLRAGLLSRLRRDTENFIVLPVVRPERASLTGVHGLLQSLGIDPASSLEAIREWAAALRAPVLQDFDRLADAAGETWAGRSPTLVLPIDQAEEFFSAENVETAAALELLARVISSEPDLAVVLTIRSDSFELLQGDVRLAGIPRQPFDLSRMAPGAFKEVIEGPGKISEPRIIVEPDLTERLLKDLDAADALPLLAFTLERLVIDHGADGKLDLREYEEGLGGIAGAIGRAVEVAFAAALQDAALPKTRAELESLARSAFIPWLVRIDDSDGRPKRRVARFSELPKASRALVSKFFDQRLLVSDRAGPNDDATVEVSHEAVLRNWTLLADWIAEDTVQLRVLEQVSGAALEFDTAHRLETGASATDDVGLPLETYTARRDEVLKKIEHLDDTQKQRIRNVPKAYDHLLHQGARLDEAVTMATRAPFADVVALRPTVRTYLEICARKAVEALEAVVKGVENSRASLARQRRVQVVIGAVVIFAASLFLLMGLFGIDRARTALAAQSRVAARDASEAIVRGDPVVASLLALEAWGDEGTSWWSPLTRWMAPDRPEASAALKFVLDPKGLRTGASAGHSGAVISATFSPDGSQVLTASFDNTARLWDARTGAQLRVLEGHGDVVISATFSPDGSQVLTASEDKTARLWDARTGAQLRVLEGHGGPVWSAIFSPDGSQVLTASADRTARLWDAGTGAQLRVLEGHGDLIWSAIFSPDSSQVLTASDDRTARLWDARTGAQLRVFEGHGVLVRSAIFSPDGSQVLTAGDGMTPRLWDAGTGAPLRVFEGHGLPVGSVIFSPDGSQVLTASDDRTARLWDAGTGAPLRVLEGHGGAVISATFSPDGSQVLTASEDKTARLWDARTGAQLRVFEGHVVDVTSAIFSPDGSQVLTASQYDKRARLWDAGTGAQLRTLGGHGDNVWSASFSPDGSQVLTASDDRTARLWDAGTGAPLRVLEGHGGAVRSAIFSPDGIQVLTASADRTARLWDAGTGAQLRVLEGHGDLIWSAIFSPDSSQVLTASDDRTARLWDARTSAQLQVFEGHGGPLRSAIFSPDGSQVLTASFDNTARLWDARTGAQLRVLEGHGGPVWSAIFSPDGSQVLTASEDKTARLWDARTGAPLRVLEGHGGPVGSAIFSPDGSHVLTASADRTARLWDAGTGAQLRVLEGHGDVIWSAIFSPDSSQVLTASDDRTARLWDARTGAQLRAFEGHGGPVGSAIFSPDRRQVLTASRDSSWGVWLAGGGALDITDEWELAEYARRKVARCLTKEERQTFGLGPAPDWCKRFADSPVSKDTSVR